MRDLIAGLVALGLFLFALGLASTLRFHLRSRERERRDLQEAGRTVIAEIPTMDGLTLFVADEDYFYCGETAISKGDIRLVRVLINGSPIASYTARRAPSDDPGSIGSEPTRATPWSSAAASASAFPRSLPGGCSTSSRRIWRTAMH